MRIVVSLLLALAGFAGQAQDWILNEPDVHKRIVDDGSQPVGSSPGAFKRFLDADLVKWTRVVKASGAKLE